MQLTSFFIVYLVLHAISGISLESCVVGGLLFYVTITLKMGGFGFSQFKIFFSAAVVIIGYVCAAKLNIVDMSPRTFYLLFACLMGIFRFESYFNWNSHMSTRRKLMISTWNAPQEGNIYGQLQVDMTKTLKYIEKKRKNTGVKVTITHIVIKAVGKLLKTTPLVNGRLVLGRFYAAHEADVGCLVSITTPQGPDLANCKICDADTKALSEIAKELGRKARALRDGKNEDFKKSKPILRLLPTFLIEPMVSLVGWLGALGFEVPALGVRPHPFGTAMVTSVGMLGLDMCFVPHTPFAHVPLIVMVGSYSKKPVVDPDTGLVVVKVMLPITVTLDHRFLDGSTGAVMAKNFKSFLTDPEKYLE